MRVACIQLCSGADIQKNLVAADGLIRQAAGEGATFIATPEMTHILQKNSDRLFGAITSEDNDKGVAFFAALAAELNIHLLIGSLAVQTSENRAANRSLLFAPDGRVSARYDKIHLFDVTVSPEETWKESRIYEAGTQLVVADVEGCKIGLSICYDIRFPHLYRDYANMGAKIITVPAAFTTPTGKAHWETLLRARAIETGSFIIAPAQGGKHEDGRQTWGHSMIIDPWGLILAQLDHDRPGLIMADLTLKAVDAARQKIPAWHHTPRYTL